MAATTTDSNCQESNNALIDNNATNANAAKVTCGKNPLEALWSE